MKKLLASTLLVFASFGIARSQGDFSFWLPSTNTSSQDAQILLNKQYVTVSLYFTEVYFKTGFLNGIKTVIISTGASHNFSGPQSAPSEQVVKATAKGTGDGQSIGAQKEAIVALVPVSGTAMSIHVTLRGTGEDKFKKLFDILGGADVKTALNLTDATVAKVGAVTNIVKGLLANPYTSDKPADILTFSNDFSFFDNNSVDRRSSMREGYIVVVSSEKSDKATFDQLRTMIPADMNKTKDIFEVRQSGLFYKSTGKLVENVSYVILVVDQAKELGEASNSAWFKKYNEALSKIQSATPTTLANALNEANNLWTEGTALLAEDKSYLASERRSLAAGYQDQIKTAATKKPGGVNLLNLVTNKRLSVFQSLTNEQIAEFSLFSKLGADTNGTLTIEVPDATDGLSVTVTSKADASVVVKKLVPSGTHEITFRNLFPGEYLIEVTQAGSLARTDRAVVSPKTATRMTLTMQDQ